MVFQRHPAGTHTAWWLVPIGVVFLIAGVALLFRGDDRSGWRGVIIGVCCVVGGVVFGLRSERLR